MQPAYPSTPRKNECKNRATFLFSNPAEFCWCVKMYATYIYGGGLKRRTWQEGEKNRFKQFVPVIYCRFSIKERSINFELCLKIRQSYWIYLRRETFRIIEISPRWFEYFNIFLFTICHTASTPRNERRMPYKKNKNYFLVSSFLSFSPHHDHGFAQLEIRIVNVKFSPRIVRANTCFTHARTRLLASNEKPYRVFCHNNL